MPSPFLHIGLVQFDITWENPAENIRRLDKLLDNQKDLDLILLPEMWSTGFTMQPEKAAEKVSGPSVQWMLEKANQLNTTIIGSLSVRDGSSFFNRLYCTYPDGQIVTYDKKHLFSYGKEDQSYTPGNSRTIIEVKGWKIFPAICYDIRFPVWCRNSEMYDLMIVVANWPTPRIHHWDALLRARAIENQSFVAAVNRIGTDENNLTYNGHSGVYDMNGQTLLFMEASEGVGHCSLDYEQLSVYRNQFRFLQDRDSFSV